MCRKEQVSDHSLSTQAEAPKFDGDSTTRNWLTTYYVVEDQITTGGRRVGGVPISPFFSAAEDAERALAVLKESHPTAWVMYGTHMYDNNAQGLEERNAFLRYVRASGDMRPPLEIRYSFDTNGVAEAIAVK